MSNWKENYTNGVMLLEGLPGLAKRASEHITAEQSSEWIEFKESLDKLMGALESANTECKVVNSNYESILNHAFNMEQTMLNILRNATKKEPNKSGSDVDPLTH